MQNIWRQNCMLCAAESGNTPLCHDCLRTLPRLGDAYCQRCSHPLATGEAADCCGHCLRHPPSYAHALAAWHYRFPLDRLIQALKYRHAFNLIESLSVPLIELASRRPLPDALVPMPLHPLRLRERGYNQSLLLARHLAKRLHIPVLAHVCQRTRYTPTQTSLPLAARQANLRGAFSCNAGVSGLRIAIVDDVMTSGSSLEHLSRAITRAGSAKVECWVLARATRSS